MIARPAPLASIALLVTLAACGGKVVFDGSGGAALGQGGASSEPTGNANHSGPAGSGGASCENAPDPSALHFCGGSSVGEGADKMCNTTYCDPTNKDEWSSTCNKIACVCRFNTFELCTCANNTPGDFCNGTPSCCPFVTPN